MIISHKKTIFGLLFEWSLKGVYFCPIEIISRLTVNGQFLYLTGLKEPKEGTNMYLF